MNKKGNVADSKLVIDLMKTLEYSGAKLGRELGMTGNSAKTYISKIKNGDLSLPDKYKLEIMKLWPKLAKKHGLIGVTDELSQVAEPIAKYEKAYKETNYIKHLEEEVEFLKNQLESLTRKIKSVELE